MMEQPRLMFFRPSDAKQVVGVSRATIYNWKKRGLLTIHKRFGMSFARFSDVEQIITGLGDHQGSQEAIGFSISLLRAIRGAGSRQRISISCGINRPQKVAGLWPKLTNACFLWDKALQPVSMRLNQWHM